MIQQLQKKEDLKKIRIILKILKATHKLSIIVIGRMVDNCYGYCFYSLVVLKTNHANLLILFL